MEAFTLQSLHMALCETKFPTPPLSLQLKHSRHFQVGSTLLAFNPFHWLQGQSWLVLACPVQSDHLLPWKILWCHSRHGMENLQPQLFSGRWADALLFRILQITLSNEIKVAGIRFLHVCKWAKAPYLIFAKHISLGNAEQKRIGNLPSSTSHQNSDRLSLQHTRILGPEKNDTWIVRSTWSRCLFLSGGFTKAGVG